MPKPIKKQKSEDRVRSIILNYLYKTWKNGRGMDSSKVQISKLKGDLKKKGLKEKEIVRNLVYLIKTCWVNEETEKYPLTISKGKKITAEKKTYQISCDGIDYFNGSSKFQKSNELFGVNITNVQGVVNIGDNNYVRNEFIDLFKALDDLGKQIRISDKISDEEKFNYQAEINTMKNQLMKSQPNKKIIKMSWDTLKTVATVNGIIKFYNKVKPFVESLLKGLIN